MQFLCQCVNTSHRKQVQLQRAYFALSCQPISHSSQGNTRKMNLRHRTLMVHY